MSIISTYVHNYIKCCCCKIDISNYMIKKEIFKNIYYTGILITCIIYNIYYFTNKDLMIDKIDFILGCFLLLSFSLIILYILNLIYLVYIIVKNKKYINIPSARIVPVTNDTNSNPTSNVQLAVIVNNN